MSTLDEIAARDALDVIGLGPHDFANPYQTFDEDDSLIECCGVQTKSGSPCGYPRAMHAPAVPHTGGNVCMRCECSVCGDTECRNSDEPHCLTEGSDRT